MKLFCLETGLDSRQPLFLLLFPPISRFKSLTHQKCCLCTCSRWKMSRRCSSPRLFKNWLMVMSSRAAEKKWCQQGFHKFWLVVQRALLCVHPPSPSFLSEPVAPSAGPVAPATVMSLRGAARLSMLLAADRHEGEGDGEMTTPPVAPVLTTLALT